MDNAFKFPRTKKIGGKLLDTDLTSYFIKSKKALLKESYLFCSALLGDGATVRRLPLLKILAFSEETSPAAIFNCTEHLGGIEIKDVTYITRLVEEK